jgi:hypothetical protein
LPRGPHAGAASTVPGDGKSLPGRPGQRARQAAGHAAGFPNPAVIAIGGSLARCGEPLLAGIREVVLGRAMPLATRTLRIVESGTGRDAGVIGASLMAVEHLFSPRGVAALLDRQHQPGR